MSWLSPWGWLWLGSLPVLFWLWRLASSRRLLRIPSLVPFEQLQRKAALRRSRLVVNWLFWLQLAALVLLAMALTDAMLLRQPAKTLLLIVDTSASMGATAAGQSRLAGAKQLLKHRVAGMASGDRALLISSAPVEVLTPEPTGEAVSLTRAIDGAALSDLSGTLATAVHVGRALLERPVDELWIATDEPEPESLPPEVRWQRVGAPQSNVALVGFDAQGQLCGARSTNLLVTVENFSDNPTEAHVTVQQDGRALTRIATTLAPHERRGLSLAVPDGATGWAEVAVRATRAAEDALAVDNRAHVMLRHGADLPIAVVSDHPPLQRLLADWLNACEPLTWTAQVPDTAQPYLLVTDRDGPVPAHAIGVLHLAVSSATSEPSLAHWVVSADHPVGSYLHAIHPVWSSMSPHEASGMGGEPVIWALRQGQRVPLALAGELDGRRSVRLLVDPTVNPDATPLLVVFFNSVRWLMSQAETVRTGEPLMVPAVARGRVSVHRPDGVREELTHGGGTFRYDRTVRAGRYRIVQGQRDVVRAANFLDPIESNVLAPASTWRRLSAAAPATRAPEPVRQPLRNPLILLVLLLLLVEWWLYTRRGQIPFR